MSRTPLASTSETRSPWLVLSCDLVLTGAEVLPLPLAFSIETYYEEIYPYLPYLPTPNTVPVSAILARLGRKTPFLTPQDTPSPSSITSAHPRSTSDSSLIKSSPFLLSILAILSLVPHPSDPNPNSQASKTLRRTASETFARASATLIASTLERAGEEDDAEIPLEVIQALGALGKWEFAQRGNMSMMRSRTGEAVRLAMELGLHKSDVGWKGESWIRDIRRRTWWLSFSGLCQSSIVSGTVRTAPLP